MEVSLCSYPNNQPPAAADPAASLIRPSRFEQDMTWLRAGIACRTAIDIALHRVGLLSAAREGLPPAIIKTIVRTWLLCFVADRTLSVQLGKPNGRQWEPEATKYVEYLRGPTGQDGNQVQPTEDDVFVACLGVSENITSLVGHDDWSMLPRCDGLHTS